MAPTKGKEALLDQCTSAITLGSSIAVKLLDYLCAAKDPPNGLNKLAVEFLETSRVLIPTRSGLSEAARSIKLPLDVANDLHEQFRRINNAFSVLNQVVTKYLEGERKSGLGKLGKGFRLMFQENDVEKLRLSLAQCRTDLARIVQARAWTLGELQVEPAAGTLHPRESLQKTMHVLTLSLSETQASAIQRSLPFLTNQIQPEGSRPISQLRKMASSVQWQSCHYCRVCPMEQITRLPCLRDRNYCRTHYRRES